MGHAAHFLRRVQRLDDHHLDLAMGLYRDPRAVRLVLDSQPLPADAGRIALALADDPDPPHIIVDRTGAFVTCLAPGMGVKRAPVIPRAAIDTALADSARLGLLDARIAHRGGVKALLARTFDAGDRLPREDYEALAVMAPFILPPLLLRVDDEARFVIDMHRSMTPRRLRRTDRDHIRDLRAYAKASATLRHLSLLIAEAAPLYIDLDVPSATLIDAADAALLPADFTGLTTAAVVAAALGPVALPAYHEKWQTADTLLDLLHPLAGLVAIGVRHPTARADALRHLAEETAPLFDEPETADYVRWLVAEARQMFDQDTIDLHEQAIRTTIRKSEADNPDIPADAPQWLIDGLIGASGGSCFGTPTAGGIWLPMITWAARRDPVELYLPNDWIRRLSRGQDVEIARAVIGGWLHYTHRGQPITRSAPRVGRNDPCPCGSGRKYKRCCLVKSG